MYMASTQFPLAMVSVGEKVRFESVRGGEKLIHRESGGNRHLFIVPSGQSGANHDHAVIRPNGNLAFLRENGIVKANDRMK